MRFATFIACAICACGIDSVPRADAPPAGTPTVEVRSPRVFESFYVTETVTVEWLAEDDGALACDVTASDGAATITIATDVATSPGQPGTTTWVLATIAPSTSYRVQVSCSDTSSPPFVGAATSGEFAVTPPPQQVSFASQIQPILSATCTSAQCHDSVMSQENLDLTSTKAFGELVNVASRQCPTTQRVKPSAPTESYLVFKLQGNGPCFQGSKMPKPPQTISSAQLQLVRDWIANGALDN